MAQKKNLRERFTAIRRRDEGRSSRVPQPTKTAEEEQEQDVTESRVLPEPWAERPNPEIEQQEAEDASKKSGEEMRTSLTIAQTEQQNNQNELVNIQRQTPAASPQTRSPTTPPALFGRFRRQAFSQPAVAAQAPSDNKEAIDELWLKVRYQDEILRNLGEASDKHAADNKVLTKKVDESTEKSKEIKTKSRDQELLIAQLRRELQVSKGSIATVEANNNWVALELIDKNAAIEKLEKELKETQRLLRESEASRAAASAATSSIDAAKIESIRFKDSAADKLEITNLKTENTALKQELHDAKVHLKQEILKAKQLAEQHANEIPKLKEEYDTLATETALTESKLKAEKESSFVRLEEMEILVKKLKMELIESKGSFRSWLRIRPPQGTLIKQPITIQGGDKVEVIDRHGSLRDFNFDRVFAPEANNASVFHDLSEILEAALQGYDITVLAYGQTGSGKTYTMSAMLDMALEQIFTELGKSYGTDYTVTGRCIEVYEGKVYDLFKPAREVAKVSTECGGMWPVREPLLQIQTAALDSIELVHDMIRQVNTNRTSGQTEKNDTSSRSHMFLSFQVKASRTEPSGAITTTRSGITFVDLAGSESLKAVTGRVTETQAINTELSALRSVLIAMGNNASRIPFRDTQLTRLLQDGFTGGKVLFIQAASLGELEESIHTMDFGSLVSKVTQKKPSKNVVTQFAATGGDEPEEPSTPTAAAGTRGAARGPTRGTPTTRSTPTAGRGSPATRGSPAPPRDSTRDRGRGT